VSANQFLRGDDQRLSHTLECPFNEPKLGISWAGENLYRDTVYDTKMRPC
jgi:hypothetical protein